MDENTLIKKRDKAIRLDDVKVLAEVQKNLGDLYYERKSLDDALEAYEEQLKACKRQNDKLNCAIAHRMIGEVHFDKGNFDVALQHQKMYLDIAQQLKDLIEEQRAFATLGRTYLGMADNLLKESEKFRKEEVLRDANKAFSKSIKLCDKLENNINLNELMMMRARLLLNLGLVREQQKETEQALNLIYKAEALCRKHNLSDDKHRTNIALAGLNERLGNIELALKNLDEAAKVEDSNMRINARLLKAELLLRLGEWMEAKKLLHNLYKNKKLLNYDRQQVIKSLRMAVVLCRNEDKLLIETNVSTKEKLYEAMGDAATAVRCLDKAIEYYSHMLFCAEETKSTQLGAALTSLAQTLRDVGKFEEAIPYARRELELCKDDKETCNSALYLTGLLIDAGRSQKEIREMFDRALASAGKCNDPTLERTVLKEFIEYHERMGNIEEMLALREKLEALPYSESQESEDIEDSETPDIGADICLEELTDSEKEDEKSQASNNVSKSVPKRPKRILKPNEKGETPLHVACIKGNVAAVKQLLADHHPANTRDYCGWTPLHEASNHGWTEIVHLLICAKANVNDQGGADCDGVTPLHDAATNGHISVIRLLLENGADPNLMTSTGLTALDYLKQWKERTERMGEYLSPTEFKEYVLVKKKLSDMMTVDTKRKNKKGKEEMGNCRALIDENAEDEANSISCLLSEEIGDWDRSEKVSMGEIYKQTIANLQPSNRRPILPKTNHKLKSIAPLLESEEMLIDHNDWLVDDVGSSHHKRDKYFDGLPPSISNNSTTNTIKRKSKTDSDIEIDAEKNTKRQRISDKGDQISAPLTDEDSKDSSNASDTNDIVEFDTGLWPKSKKKRQLSLLKQGFTKINLPPKSPSPITVLDSPKPESVNVRLEHERRSWESSLTETFDLEVELDSQIFELKLHFRDLRKTINDIEELIRHKFEANTGCRPKIRFKTVEGQTLPAEASLESIPRDKHLLILRGEIAQNDLPPMVDRYKKICETCGVDVTDSMLKSLRSCENTSTFRLNNVDEVEDIKLEALVKCLRYQINLQCLHLSGATFFAHGNLLNLMVVKLNNLCELHLQGCNIDNECLEQIQNLPIELRVLDLSYNPLGSKSQKKLLTLIEPLKRLQTLNLRACELDDFRFKFSSDSLINLDISWNPIGGDGAANFLQRQLLSLNLSNTLSNTLHNHSNVIDKIFFKESESFSFKTLECLELSSCQATDFDVEKILSKTPNLTRLVLNNNVNVTVTSLCAILMRKPTLNFIDLSGCSLIEELPQSNLRIVTPQICKLLVHMKPLVVDAWETLWQGKGRAKKLPHSLVMFRPL